MRRWRRSRRTRSRPRTAAQERTAEILSCGRGIGRPAEDRADPARRLRGLQGRRARDPGRRGGRTQQGGARSVSRNRARACRTRSGGSRQDPAASWTGRRTNRTARQSRPPAGADRRRAPGAGRAEPARPASLRRPRRAGREGPSTSTCRCSRFWATATSRISRPPTASAPCSGASTARRLPHGGDSAFTIAAADGRGLPFEGRAQAIDWEARRRRFSSFARPIAPARTRLARRPKRPPPARRAISPRCWRWRSTAPSSSIRSAASRRSTPPRERLFGYAAKDVAGESVLMLLAPPSQPAATAGLEALSRASDGSPAAPPLAVVGRTMTARRSTSR